MKPPSEHLTDNEIRAAFLRRPFSVAKRLVVLRIENLVREPQIFAGQPRLFLYSRVSERDRKLWPDSTSTLKTPPGYSETRKDLDTAREEIEQAVREIVVDLVASGRAVDDCTFVITNEVGETVLTYPLKRMAY